MLHSLQSSQGSQAIMHKLLQCSESCRSESRNCHLRSRMSAAAAAALLQFTAAAALNTQQGWVGCAQFQESFLHNFAKGRVPPHAPQLPTRWHAVNSSLKNNERNGKLCDHCRKSLRSQARPALTELQLLQLPSIDFIRPQPDRSEFRPAAAVN